MELITMTLDSFNTTPFFGEIKMILSNTSPQGGTTRFLMVIAGPQIYLRLMT
jgi:hypothetical protein